MEPLVLPLLASVKEENQIYHKPRIKASCESNHTWGNALRYDEKEIQFPDSTSLWWNNFEDIALSGTYFSEQ